MDRDRIDRPGRTRRAELVTDVETGGEVVLTVENEGAGLSVHVPGYGTADTAPGAGPVVLVEVRAGVPYVVAWGDITSEEPTATLSLSGAAETLRLPDDPPEE